MSLCICNHKKKNGMRKCRAPVIDDGNELACGALTEFARIVGDKITPAPNNRADVGWTFDAAEAVIGLRAASWTLKPPATKRSAK